MLSSYSVQKILYSSDWHEDEISRRIIVPCLQKISDRSGYFQRDIRFTGGAHEKGSDIEYYEVIGPDKVRLYTGIQVKKGNISISEATKLIIQGTLAFEKTIIDPASGIPYRINRWIVASTGEISPPAKEEIYKTLARYGKLISFWEGGFLGELIAENFHHEFISTMQVDPKLASSDYVLINLWDPTQPQVLLDDFSKTQWTKVDISLATPPTSIGILIKVIPIGGNAINVKCLAKSSKDEILIDSFLSQHNPPLLKIIPGEQEIEIKLIEEGQIVNVVSSGFAFER